MYRLAMIALGCIVQPQQPPKFPRLDIHGQRHRIVTWPRLVHDATFRRLGYAAIPYVVRSTIGPLSDSYVSCRDCVWQRVWKSGCSHLCYLMTLRLLLLPIFTRYSRRWRMEMNYATSHAACELKLRTHVAQRHSLICVLQAAGTFL